jgi:hypothetical protein
MRRTREINVFIGSLRFKIQKKLTRVSNSWIQRLRSLIFARVLIVPKKVLVNLRAIVNQSVGYVRTKGMFLDIARPNGRKSNEPLILWGSLLVTIILSTMLRPTKLFRHGLIAFHTPTLQLPHLLQSSSLFFTVRPRWNHLLKWQRRQAHLLHLLGVIHRLRCFLLQALWHSNELTRVLLLRGDLTPWKSKTVSS